jgi:hypothetical protein
MAKNPTQWFPGNRQGSAILIANLIFQDNLGNTIVDNTTSHNTLVTTTIRLVAPFATVWSQV